MISCYVGIPNYVYSFVTRAGKNGWVWFCELVEESRWQYQHNYFWTFVESHGGSGKIIFPDDDVGLSDAGVRR